MKAVGDWVVVKSEEKESTHGILSLEENKGTVIDCQCDSSLIGKTIFYSIEKAKKNRGFIFVQYSDIYGVEE
jgi:hypothetical protein